MAADAGRGLALRLDHGSQYLADHCQSQLKHWGINPSFAFIEQPQPNGEAKSFLRTVNEQVISGQVFQNLEGIRDAVWHCVDAYNRERLAEKKGFLSPWQARAQWLAPNPMPGPLKKNLGPENRMRYTATSPGP